MAVALPRVAISLGDPRGIGPEVVAKALADPRVQQALQPMIFGERASQENDRENGRAALAAVEAAAQAVMRGDADALCTAPLSKQRVALAHHGFQGHTEHLAALAGAQVAMMMAGPRLRVVLATNHVRLADVPRKLTSEGITSVVALADRELREKFRIASPRIAVCGLNPHAGDGGLFGDEDERIVRPAVEAARKLGIDARGPLPADGLFPKAAQGSCDAVVALYHDQGLIPAKLLDFRETVNVTLGLPWPRTSPDHGTADEIAGKGVADPEPMISALLLAARLARRD